MKQWVATPEEAPPAGIPVVRLSLSLSYAVHGEENGERQYGHSCPVGLKGDSEYLHG